MSRVHRALRRLRQSSLIVLTSVYVATVSFLTIFIESAWDKIVAASVGLLLFPLGWLILRWESRHGQIPPDLAEEFASLSGYEIVVPPTEWSKRRAYEVAARKFGSDTIPPEQLDGMTQINPNSLLILTFGGSVIGYTDFYVLNPPSLERFVAGELTEHDLNADMLVPHPVPDTVTDIYLAGITVVDCHSYEGKRQASMLIWGLVEVLCQCFLGVRSVRLYALGWSEEGRVLLEKANFQRVDGGKPRKDGFPLYTRSATKADCQQWLRTHRNWTGVCELRLECVTSVSRTQKGRRGPRRQAAGDP